MSTQATGKNEVTGWDEKPYEEFENGGKLTRASVTMTFQGDITGESAVEYLMNYSPNGIAYYVGLQRVTGQLAGRSGSFVLQLSGRFENDTATGEWFVVPGSATGELVGLDGEGLFLAPSGATPTYTLVYNFG